MESRRVGLHLDLNDQTLKLAKVLCEFQKVAARTNVIGAFRKAEIMF
jgi:hypothetical protein